MHVKRWQKKILQREEMLPFIEIVFGTGSWRHEYIRRSTDPWSLFFCLHNPFEGDWTFVFALNTSSTFVCTHDDNQFGLHDQHFSISKWHVWHILVPFSLVAFLTANFQVTRLFDSYNVGLPAFFLDGKFLLVKNWSVGFSLLQSGKKKIEVFKCRHARNKR